MLQLARRVCDMIFAYFNSYRCTDTLYSVVSIHEITVQYTILALFTVATSWDSLHCRNLRPKLRSTPLLRQRARRPRPSPSAACLRTQRCSMHGVGGLPAARSCEWHAFDMRIPQLKVSMGIW
jgi:hypothetical protein